MRISYVNTKHELMNTCSIYKKKKKIIIIMKKKSKTRRTYVNLVFLLFSLR